MTVRPTVMVVFTVSRAKVRGVKNILRVFDFQGRGYGSGSSQSCIGACRDAGSMVVSQKMTFHCHEPRANRVSRRKAWGSVALLVEKMWGLRLSRSPGRGSAPEASVIDTDCLLLPNPCVYYASHAPYSNN